MISFETRLFIGIFFKARDSFQRGYFFRNYDAAKNFISSTRFYDSNNKNYSNITISPIHSYNSYKLIIKKITNQRSQTSNLF